MEATTAGEASAPRQGLSIFVADGGTAGSDELAGLLAELGHEPTKADDGLNSAAIAATTADPDVIMVTVDPANRGDLDIVEQLAAYCRGPVVALLDDENPEFVAEAAERGIFAYVRPVEGETLQSAIDVAVRRHSDAEALVEKVDQLETALDRRAIIERAKGILMGRHELAAQEAFELLRRHARSSNRRVVDVARSVTDGHTLLPNNGS